VHEDDIKKAAFALRCREDVSDVINAFAGEDSHVCIDVTEDPDGTGNQHAWFHPSKITHHPGFRKAANKIVLDGLALMAEDFAALAREAMGQEIELVVHEPDPDEDGEDETDG
jgi:hypothetical protein